jgi:hypothetical protein
LDFAAIARDLQVSFLDNIIWFFAALPIVLPLEETARKPGFNCPGLFWLRSCLFLTTRGNGLLAGFFWWPRRITRLAIIMPIVLEAIIMPSF